MSITHLDQPLWFAGGTQCLEALPAKMDTQDRCSEWQFVTDTWHLVAGCFRPEAAGQNLRYWTSARQPKSVGHMTGMVQM
jgi:hypothetical protein